jgi:hypothetical protein
LDKIEHNLEHISNVNKLGIINRLVRTLRELIEKYYDITGHRTDNIKDVMKSIIDTYCGNRHRTLDNKTPNQAFKDNDDQIARHIYMIVSVINKDVKQFHLTQGIKSGY